MKTEQVILALTAQARALGIAGTQAGELTLKRLCEALESKRDSTVAQVCKTLTKVRPEGSGLGAGNVPAILGAIPHLSALQELLSVAGAKPLAKDLALLVRALDPIAELSIAGLGDALRSTQPGKQVGASEKSVPPLDLVLARKVADGLTEASRDDHRFKAAMADLRAHKHSKSMVDAIANIFLGRRQPWSHKSIAEAMKKIEERHALDALSESRARTIDRINV